MKRVLKTFMAGKVSTDSPYAHEYWRDDLLLQTNQLLTNYRLTDTSIIAPRNQLLIEHDLPAGTIFAQSCYYIQHSDILLVNLTDDISVGGSQEIFIAKQHGVRVIGLAPRGGKFNRLKYGLGGKTYWNWLHPFVGGLCDLVVNDVAELASAIDDYSHIPNGGLPAIGAAINYYQRNASAQDTTVNRILSFDGEQHNKKPKMRIYFAGKMGKAAGYSEAQWRDHFAKIVSRHSRFGATNLDFLEASHSVVDEHDAKLIFGRDAYLIRSADAVVVNLSDDISVGGAVEMMLAKLYQRPLVGITAPDGKFMSPEKDMFGRRVKNYISPFVSATCDWLVHTPEQLPAVIDALYTGPVKTNRIIFDASKWYHTNIMPLDQTAQRVLA